MSRRIERLNSLLKEVISDVVRLEMKNPHLSRLITITSVELSKDLQHAKVFVSVIGDKQAKEKAIGILDASSGFIAMSASHHVVMRYFPELKFYLDDTVDKQMHIESIIQEIQEKRKKHNVE